MEERQLVHAQGAWPLWGEERKEAVLVIGEVELELVRVQVPWAGGWTELT